MKKITLLFCFLLCIRSYTQNADIKTLIAKASKGDIEAQAYLALCYEKGTGVAKS